MVYFFGSFLICGSSLSLYYVALFRSLYVFGTTCRGVQSKRALGGVTTCQCSMTTRKGGITSPPKILTAHFKSDTNQM
jgi:hypothetical protein